MKLAIVRIGRGLVELQGLYLAALFAKFRSVEMMNVGSLILSDLTPKIECIWKSADSATSYFSSRSLDPIDSIG